MPLLCNRAGIDRCRTEDSKERAGMMQVVETFGLELMAWMGGVAAGYLAWASAPFWWPAMRAFCGRRRLPRPLLFSACAGCLAYAAYLALLVALRLLILAVPPLSAGLEQLASHPGIAATLLAALVYGLPLLVFTGWTARFLGARWARVMAPSPDAQPAP
ncbi:hypothetical protein SOM22_17950 [Stenotrophomonas rhizophila]|uniref:hypothetical protein n=1 Tax=Stenotrophomonas rhizophila TaxID=216778 RepID=UPI002A6A8B0F|nr:hypothetical protein [Stenotrophomonas rhizophila]MDY0956456.1 hypothetical protein [Stenotrophomonas rhizophila]